eukprot:m.84781 g.84781  ORF g.84781 m.84781 type:complete len:59 (-) comp14401_c0_seq1:97-273(-)
MTSLSSSDVDNPHSYTQQFNQSSIKNYQHRVQRKTHMQKAVNAIHVHEKNKKIACFKT